jgi:predicted RNA-binding Zn-ribbon protein involved in translation (DUF1610 family)
VTDAHDGKQPPEFLLEFGRQRAAFWANPPRGTCPECKTDDAIMHAQPEGSEHDQLCAACSGVQAVMRRLSEEFQYPCDDCGAGKAFRDPLTREDIYRCRECHAKHGYVPGERALISQIETRQGFTHSQGRRDPCSAAGRGTECAGEVKPRGKLGILCAKHHNPRLFR